MGKRIQGGRYIVMAKYKNNHCRAGISNEVAKVIYAKGLKCYELGTNDYTGEVYLIFTKHGRHHITFSTGKRTSENERYLAIHNKRFFNWMDKHYNLGAEYNRVYFMLSDDMSNSNDYATFKIESKQ